MSKPVFTHHLPGTEAAENQLAALRQLIDALKVAETHGLHICIEYRRGPQPFDKPDKVVVEARTWRFPEGYPDERAVLNRSEWDISFLFHCADIREPGGLPVFLQPKRNCCNCRP